MARSRQRAAELVRLLNSSEQPIYALDEEQTLIFWNKACLEWLGFTPDEMMGRRCAYHSSPELTGADAQARRENGGHGARYTPAAEPNNASHPHITPIPSL